MTRRYQRSVVIFRRDLRVEDNTALNAAMRASQQVLPCFIFDPRQIQKHPYQSQPALHFMMQSLADLQQQLHAVGGALALYTGLPEAVLRSLHTQQPLGAVYVNRDYTPFSRRRDEAIAQVCAELGIDFYSLSDTLLVEPEQALKPDHTPYQVFTPYYHNAQRRPVALPAPLAGRQFLPPVVAADLELATLADVAEREGLQGGRSAALALLQSLPMLSDYQTTRDVPALSATSQLSAHLKFGTCSVREAYHAIRQHLGSDHALLRQLYWRDFFTHIGFYFPKVFGQPFLDKYALLSWDNRMDYFQAWSSGMTGFPIVDAGMRELNATGFMHNRLRMITASFLVKDLHVSWRWGERYFAQHLVDYDPAVNNGNWQWAASTGCDAQPYFRIFNPWRQQQKFDPQCGYIYRWLPELRGFSPDIIHHWETRQVQCAYPAPIVDHGRESALSKARFKAAGDQLGKSD
ncbi:MAG: deoxyribodipyrimidine photo-lyase [Methylococcaceae bacterium]|nr:deoxyribodipyrimidine photo-lyase [Methylococcaceae bacterium]